VKKVTLGTLRKSWGDVAGDGGALGAGGGVGVRGQGSGVRVRVRGQGSGVRRQGQAKGERRKAKGVKVKDLAFRSPDVAE